MHVSDVTDLLTHMDTADAAMWKAVLATPAAESADMRARLHHMHVVQQIYLQIWRGETMSPRELESFKSLSEIAEWAKAYYARVKAWAATITESDLQREIKFPWAEDIKKRLGYMGTATLSDTVLQVALHTAHHRGQVLMHLRQLGAEPPLTDFIAWVWQGKPIP